MSTIMKLCRAHLATTKESRAYLRWLAKDATRHDKNWKNESIARNATRKRDGPSYCHTRIVNRSASCVSQAMGSHGNDMYESSYRSPLLIMAAPRRHNTREMCRRLKWMIIRP